MFYCLTDISSTNCHIILQCLLLIFYRYDTYAIFKEPVVESQAPGYYDVITNPMDFGTMKSKLEEGKYGGGSDAMAKLYEDLLLVFDNCRKFNEDGGEVLDEAAKVFGFVPITFSKACEEVGRWNTKTKRRGK